MKKNYTSPFEFADDFQLAYKNYWNQANDIDQQIERLKKKKEQLFYPRLKDELHKLVVEIQKELKADAFEVSPHGGLSNRASVYFTKGKPSEKDSYSNVVGYLSFAEFRDGKLCITNVSGRYVSEGDIIEITKEVDLKRLAKIARKNK